MNEISEKRLQHLREKEIHEVGFQRGKVYVFIHYVLPLIIGILLFANLTIN